MAKLQPVRGTHDLLPEAHRRHRFVGDAARDACARYGYDEMATPIFEFSEVFSRSIGDATDIVTKEMYSFVDRGGEDITLRPENTAGVVRAIISNGLTQSLPLKYFYCGPMFRYERPQKGRQRQFHQIGVELIGVAEPQGDVEVIAAGAAVLDALGVRAHTTLELNTLGDGESRANYRNALVQYFRGYETKLSVTSQERLERNPLRILDSKEEEDYSIVIAAPSFTDFLTPAANDFFARVTDGLNRLDIKYTPNPRLVRGLDYYGHTAFEFTTTALGAQGTVMGGGRYDGLVELMGGPPTPGVGWAAGVERLAMLVADPQAAKRPVAVIPVGEAAEREAPALAERLRRAGFRVELGYRGNVKKRFAAASTATAAAAVIVGDAELAATTAQVKDLDSGEQADVPLAALEDRLARFR